MTPKDIIETYIPNGLPHDIRRLPDDIVQYTFVSKDDPTSTIIVGDSINDHGVYVELSDDFCADEDLIGMIGSIMQQYVLLYSEEPHCDLYTEKERFIRRAGIVPDTAKHVGKRIVFDEEQPNK